MRKDRDRFNLLCDIGDIGALLTESSDIESFLQSTMMMISSYLNADACSIYLYDEKSEELVLKGAVGLGSDIVGRIRMKPGESFVGNTFEKLQPIREACATLNPDSKSFEETRGKRFESFLTMPVRRGTRNIGVLVVRHKQRDYFNEIDVVVLRAMASQLAGVLEKTRLPSGRERKGRQAKVSDIGIFKTLRSVKGESASGGYAYAGGTVFKRSHAELLADAPVPDNAYSLEDFYQAVQKTSDQLMEFQNRLAEQLLESASLIFEAHFMILKDAQFINKIVNHIIKGTPPPKAVIEVTNHYIDIFSSSSNEYVREKVTDMEDLSGRILRNLYNWSGEESGFGEGSIVIARDLYPSEILKLASEDVKGIILVRGGVTSHVSILARSLKIPMVIADRPKLLNLPEGVPILLDADTGTIYVAPEKEMIQQIETREKARTKPALVKAAMSPTTQTRDGVRVHLLANINLLTELAVARDLKAEGIGLYRTEFPFLIRPTFPSEEDQYLIYKRLFDEMPNQEITVRTLDIGGDKMPACSNPVLGADLEIGLRSIRFSLRHQELFEQQLRAILRAGSETRDLRIMFPMISSLDEFEEARQIVFDCIRSLEHEGMPHHQGPAVGAMIELPSVLGIIRELAHEADFFSVGTNDFVQYMLAVDRSNEKVADYYQPYHPSVLRGLEQIARAAIIENKDISICGEMAHEPEYIPFLIGIGVRRISVDPQFLPLLQKRISRMKLSEAEKQAKDLLAESTLKGTREILQRHAGLTSSPMSNASDGTSPEK